MSWILYMPQRSNEAERFLESLSSNMPEMPYWLCQTTDELLRLLGKAYVGTRIVILFLQTREELEKILPLRSYFETMKIIVVLPDEESMTISKALTLMPRYKAYLSDNFKELCAVLKKMIRLYDRESYVST